MLFIVLILICDPYNKFETLNIYRCWLLFLNIIMMSWWRCVLWLLFLFLLAGHFRNLQSSLFAQPCSDMQNNIKSLWHSITTSLWFTTAVDLRVLCLHKQGNKDVLTQTNTKNASKSKHCNIIKHIKRNGHCDTHVHLNNFVYWQFFLFLWL